MLIRALLTADPPTRRRLSRVLQPTGVELASATTRETLWERLTHEDFDLVLLGGSILPDSAVALAGSIRGLPDPPEIIVLRPREDATERARLLAAGCIAVLWLGLPDAMLTETIGSFITRRRQDAVRRLRADRPTERYSLDDFIAASPAMQRFLLLARRVVSSDSALLILGETGVGKERLARAIHAESQRKDGPFLAINCGALPESLLESELFGHEEGAFTGATRARRGYFEMAHRGTLFLDEIGDMPQHLQVKLLRVIEDHRVRRVGGERAIAVDVRIMAATNRDLEAEMKAKRFRADLYYRLAVVALTLPPLRDRQEDVVPLLRHYLEHFRATLGRVVTKIQPEAEQALAAYDWPGNVRELINVMERAVLLCPGQEIRMADLPSSIAGRTRLDRARRPVGDAIWDAVTDSLLHRPLTAARDDLVATFERRYLTRLLEATRGRVADTARKAGVNTRTLYDLMRRHDLKKEPFRRREIGG